MSIRILIADDNVSVRAAMHAVLEGADRWEIIEAEDGKEAVDKALELRPNLVILDLAMPVMDGLAASREIAKILPGTPILLHTLYSSPQVELEAGKCGVLRVVPKSEAKVLMSAVTQVLDPGSGKVDAESISPGKVTRLRRTEDTIRTLCMQLLTSKGDTELEELLAKLREALRHHIQNFRARVLGYPAMPERRVRGRLLADEAVMEGMLQAARLTNKVIPITGTTSASAEAGPEPKASNG
jgi:DNA-binding NarL/FixJ family response regulator